MHKYELMAVCGEGFYGTVFRSRVKGSKRLVAIKQFKGAEDYATKREIEVLTRLKHPNIIQLVECLRPNGKLHMVFEFLDNDLLNILTKEYPQGMPEKLVRAYTQQICQGLEYCHQRNIIHRDIKPENCLVSGDHRNINSASLKLCDFGEARVVNPGDKKLSAIIGTRWYRAPEILNGCKATTGHTGSNAADCGSVKKVIRPKLLEYTSVSDLWGVGCIMGELIIGSPLFPADTDLQQLAVVTKFSTLPQLKKRMGDKLSPDGLQILTGLLQVAPSKRLTATAVVKHHYSEGTNNDNDGVDHRENFVGGDDDFIAEEVADDDDDDSFDGEFSDFEDDEKHPATNDKEDFEDEDTFDDDEFDDDKGIATRLADKKPTRPPRPDSPVMAVFKAKPKPKPQPKLVEKKEPSELESKSTSKKAKAEKEGKRKNAKKHRNAKKASKPPTHSKKKHRHRSNSRHGRRKKKSSKDKNSDLETANKKARRRRKKAQIPSYARATSAASSRSRATAISSQGGIRSKEKKHKHRSKSKKRRKHQNTSRSSK